MKTSGGPGNWTTPAAIRQQLCDEYGLDLDVAAEAHNALTPRFLRDAFAERWKTSCRWFCNPPYGNIRPWVDRALQEASRHGNQGIALLPASTDTTWFNAAISSGHCRFWLFVGRIHFAPPEGTKASTPSIGNVLIEFLAGYRPDVNPFIGLRSARTGEPLVRYA